MQHMANDHLAEGKSSVCRSQHEGRDPTRGLEMDFGQEHGVIGPGGMEKLSAERGKV